MFWNEKELLGMLQGDKTMELASNPQKEDLLQLDSLPIAADSSFPNRDRIHSRQSIRNKMKTKNE